MYVMESMNLSSRFVDNAGNEVGYLTLLVNEKEAGYFTAYLEGELGNVTIAETYRNINKARKMYEQDKLEFIEMLKKQA